MTAKERASIPQRRVVVLLVLLPVVISGLGLYAIRFSRLRQTAAVPLVGTWRGEGIGNILNIRSDGTARSQSSYPSNGIGYFEWTYDGKEFAFYQYGSRNSVGAWYSRAMRATVGLPPTDRYEVIETSPTRFRLRAADGDVITFIATEDRDL